MPASGNLRSLMRARHHQPEKGQKMPKNHTECAICGKDLPPNISGRDIDHIKAACSDLDVMAELFVSRFAPPSGTPSKSLLEQIVEDVCDECLNPTVIREALEPMLTKILDDPLNLPILFCWHDAETGKAVR